VCYIRFVQEIKKTIETPSEMGEFLFGRYCIILLMKIEFIADKLQVSGPRSTDNSFVVKLETGEYNNEKMG